MDKGAWQANMLSAARAGAAKTSWPVVRQDCLENVNDATLILELIGRGYAVAKLPAEELAEANK